jgi:REP element-mobilizing transposase RayT
MPRQTRLDAPGTLHHVIIRGIEKRSIVDNQTDREDFVSRMGKIAANTETVIYAWALMKNHAHIFLRSSVVGLSKYMRRFLTGYAINYNYRHQRHGHLFQNRYRSIVCEEDSYFLELVRYIHLNPLRANLVKDMAKLDRYPWCGHSVVMGRIKNEWQDRDYVLSWFGKKEGEARKAYRKHIKEGVADGKRPELVGGGLLRSQGGWSQVMSMRRQGNRELADERILGSGEFVEQVIKEADDRTKYQFPKHADLREIEAIVKRICKKANISIKELKSGSRRRCITEIRSRISYELVKDHGVSLAETARQVGVSTSAVEKSMKRRIQ